jgi:flagellar hook assembly protein FlgD
VPLVSDFYTIDNTPVNGKRLVFLKGDETNVPLFETNLTDGMVMSNSTGATFQLIGTASYTLTAFRILALDDTLVRELTTYTWDGTDLNGQEVPNGVYKFELILSNSGSSYTYNGHVIVK